MKLAIVGSRYFNDYKLLVAFVDILNKCFTITEIISGGCSGADKLAEKYANDNKIPLKVFKPNWNLGKKAGYIRNKLIVNHADYVIAFPLKESKGTWITINLAKNKIPVWIIQENASKFIFT